MAESRTPWMCNVRIYLCWTLFFTMGCGGEAPRTASEAISYDTGGQAPARPESEFVADPETENGETPTGETSPAKVNQKRHIVYRSTVDLVVEDFDPVPSQIEQLVTQFAGFVASSQISGSPGIPRHGEWVARVPVEQYPVFLEKVRQLGEVRDLRTTSDDVTAEYYDVDARIRNKRLEEERLLQLLAEQTGKLEDVLVVEKELSRVRGEIEQALGRMRVLKDLTQLTTVTISVTEIRNYVPEEAPTYFTKVRRTFGGSIDGLVVALQIASLVIVALIPWLILPVGLLLLVLIVRRFRHGKH